VATLGGHDAWVASVTFSPDGTELLSVSGGAEIRVWDTRPLGSRFLRSDADVARDARAVALVDALLRATDDPDVVIHDLQARTDLPSDDKEAALRVAHRLRGTEEALIARLWRDVTPPRLDPLRRWIARGLASGMDRAAGHRNRQDSRRVTLWGALTCRLGDYELAVERLCGARMLNEEREPALFAVDLAFLTMAHAGLEQVPDAALVFAQLQRLLAEHPALRDPRLDGFVAEAREALAQARKAVPGK
jgi:hypothetical protein